MPVAPPDSGPSLRRRSGWTDFTDTLTDLRQLCPAAMPVVVLIARLSETFPAECCRRRRRFVIRLNDQMEENQAIDVLLHEWGRPLAWNHLLDRLAKSPDTSPEEFEQGKSRRGLGMRLRTGLAGVPGG